MTAQTFGELLKAARMRAGFESYTKLAAFLRQNKRDYANETIGNWERNLRHPARGDLLIVLIALSENGGFDAITDVQNLLDVGDYDRLTTDEIEAYFPNLPDDIVIPNLPPKPYDHLIGRDELVDEIGEQLTDPRAPRMIVISGLGGIGKTALAHEVIRRVMLDDTYDTLLWQSVKSEEFISTSISRRQAAANFNEAMLGYARQLNLDERLIQLDRVQAALTENFTAGACLVVLDNLESLTASEFVARELQQMVGSSPRSRVLITSRERLVSEPYLVDHYVSGLSQPATLELLRDEARRRKAKGLLEAEKSLLDRIYQVTGGMPLAIKLIVSQYLLGTSLEEELDKLIGAVDEEQLYRFIYFDIWHKLPLDAQKLLVGAATVAHAMMRSTLLEVSELSADAFSGAVPELVRVSLMDVLGHTVAERQRYELHPITRWFVNIVLQGIWKDGNPSPV